MRRRTAEAVHVNDHGVVNVNVNGGDYVHVAVNVHDHDHDHVHDDGIYNGLMSEFRRSANGKYMERDGAAGGWAFCNKKLCFTATDQGFLIELLAELAGLSDCRYVKYSIDPRDGMYLGRCFMLTEDRVGALWARYKNHPKLMVSIQDDDFTAPFRTAITEERPT